VHIEFEMPQFGYPALNYFYFSNFISVFYLAKERANLFVLVVIVVVAT